jgi:hypothetical protein
VASSAILGKRHFFQIHVQKVARAAEPSEDICCFISNVFSFQDGIQEFAYLCNHPKQSALNSSLLISMEVRFFHQFLEFVDRYVLCLPQGLNPVLQKSGLLFAVFLGGLFPRTEGQLGLEFRESTGHVFPKSNSGAVTARIYECGVHILGARRSPPFGEKCMNPRPYPVFESYFGAAMLVCGITWFWDYASSLYFPGQGALNLTLLSAAVYLEAAMIGAFTLTRRILSKHFHVGMRVGLGAWMANTVLRLILFELGEALGGVVIYFGSFMIGGFLGGLLGRVFHGPSEGEKD